jgi:hypothetical protein
MFRGYEYEESDFRGPTQAEYDALLDKYEHAQDHLVGLIEALQQTGNIEKAIYSLAEVAHALNVKFDDSVDFVVEKKTSDLVKWFTSLSIEHARNRV